MDISADMSVFVCSFFIFEREVGRDGKRMRKERHLKEKRRKRRERKQKVKTEKKDGSEGDLKGRG